MPGIPYTVHHPRRTTGRGKVASREECMTGRQRSASQVALVGGAHIHTPNFVKRLQARDDVKVAAVWDHDAGRARRYADTFGVEPSDLDAIWGNDEIAAAIVCAETERHEDLVLAATAARKHLFVEKP